MDTQQLVLKPLAVGLIFSGMLALAGCGSSGGSSTTATPAPTPTAAPITLTGTAAGGAAIPGATVNAICASGTGTATTGATGNYSLTLTGIAPCMLQVTDPNNAANVYYSAAPAGTTAANITPLTTLVVANALGTNPATAYTGFGSSTASNITTGTLSAAVTNVSTALVAVGVTIPAGTNPLTATFTAATEATSGSALDQQIDTLMSSLANANVSLSKLITAVAAPNATASAVTSAVSTLAASSGISSSTLTSTAAAGSSTTVSCPYATSGNYLIAGVGDTAFQQISFNFSKLTGSNVTKSQSFTITAGVDPNNPCAFSVTAGSQTINIRVSQSGVGGFSTAALPTTSSTPLSTSSMGLALPAPLTPYAVADVKGTWQVATFNQATSASYWGNSFAQLVIDGSGNASHYPCAGGTTCATTADMTGTVIGPDSTGVFTLTGSDSSVRRFAIYRSVSGDMTAFGVVASSSTLKGEFFVASQRISAPIVRTVGSSYSLTDWQVTNSSTAGVGLVQAATPKTFTVTAVTSNPYTFSRYLSPDNLNVDTIDVNAPRVGMLTRPALAVSSTNDSAKNPWIAVNSLGWTVYGSTATGAPSSTNPVFYGISIQAPNQ